MAATAPICEFGWKAIDFALEGIDGRTYTLDKVRGANGTLVMFICNHCPYVRSIIGRIVRDAEDLKAVGIGSVAIMANDTESYPEDSFENMKVFAEQHHFGFPYVVDRTQVVARAYGAACTPDFFGFNKSLELQYRGRLDASKTTLVKDAPRELYEAMRLVARTGRGPVEQIPSMGCSIKWRAA
jgi:peroxiredoxin